MVSGRNRFNIYLLLLLALAAGCQTGSKEKKDKRTSTIRIHLECSPDSTSFSRTVSVVREKPVMVTVDTSPVLTEAEVAGAKVVEQEGGFALQIQFNKRGIWLLEECTTMNPGRHLAIFAEFGTGMRHSRWIAAPSITHRISNGELTFTPDASREEADDIAAGLQNVAKKIAEKSKW